MSPQVQNQPSSTLQPQTRQTRAQQDVEFLRTINIESTGDPTVDAAIAKYARRMGGNIDAIINYRDAMVQRANQG